MMTSTTNLSGTEGLSGTRARVQSAIANASAKTGVDFSYLLQQAKIESGLNPTAKAGTSSATGLYQFIDQSWLGVVKQHGEEHGLAWASAAISRGSDGRYHVSDSQTRQAILALRNDPEVAATMAAEHAADNQAILEKKLGRDVESVDLYMAHFLGVGGASRFLKGYDENPDASAASVLPAAARANRWVFYNKDGSARSFAEVRDRFAARFAESGGSGSGSDGDVESPQVPEATLPRVQLTSLDSADTLDALGLNTGATTTNSLLSPSPQYARLAYMMLANLGA